MKQTLTVISLSPWLSNREAVDSQHPPQRILGTVDDVLLLLVVQLLLDDVLTQVEHDLQKEHNRCIMEKKLSIQIYVNHLKIFSMQRCLLTWT